jgi:hypothetical protein
MFCLCQGQILTPAEMERHAPTAFTLLRRSGWRRSHYLYKGRCQPEQLAFTFFASPDQAFADCITTIPTLSTAGIRPSHRKLLKPMERETGIEPANEGWRALRLSTDGNENVSDIQKTADDGDR